MPSHITILSIAIAISIGSVTPVENDDNRKEVYKLIDEIASEIEGEITEQGFGIVKTDDNLDEKKQTLLFKDIGFKILVKVYPKLRKLWEIDNDSEETAEILLSRITHSTVLKRFSDEVSGNGLASRSQQTSKTGRKYAMALKKSATQFVKLMLLAFNPPVTKKDELENTTTQE